MGGERRRAPSGAGRPGSLPEAVTSFVGRRSEIAAARERLTGSRLVTLVGPGGVGKTRLALETAAVARRAFPDGVHLVELANVEDPERVAQAVLAALDAREQSTRDPVEQLVARLADRHALLVLDNCEHVLDACAVLCDRLLRAAPALRVLATSREGLGIDGEHLYAVPTLSVPDPERPPAVDAVGAYEAVDLLVHRARAVRPDFAVTAENLGDVVALCALLDGVPLAIELAATRLRSLPVAEVVRRLDDRFGFLTGGSRAARPRQQTLRALIDWSHDLCTPEERRLWARLSVFRGGFDLDAAEGVCADDDLPRAAIVDFVDHLVAKSIVLAERRGERVRYRMLVTVRAYGEERLAASGEGDAIRRGHRDHFLARARTMAATWCGPGQEELLARMRDDHPNLRAALEHAAADGDPTTFLSLAAALRFHWIVGGFIPEGRLWLDRALAAAEDPTRERGEALWVAAWVSLLQGDRDAATARIDACRRLGSQLGNEALRAYAAQWEGLSLLFCGEVAAAVAPFRRALRGHDGVADPGGVLMTLFQLAPSLAYAGELAESRRACRDAMTLSVDRGEHWARAYAHWATGIVAWHERDLDAADEAARHALALAREFRDGVCAGLAIELLAWVAGAREDHDAAADLLGAARAVWSEIGSTMHAFGPHMDADSRACATAAEAAIGRARFAARTAERSGLGIEAALALALDDEPVGDDPAEESPLSPREAEVAGLVARGMSNRAVAEHLVLSVRTVDGHVERILAKLGFGSRSQVAAWVAERDTAARV